MKVPSNSCSGSRLNVPGKAGSCQKHAMLEPWLHTLDLVESITLHNIHYAFIRYQLQGLTGLRPAPNFDPLGFD